jgi:hypothetical protein
LEPNFSLIAIFASHTHFDETHLIEHGEDIVPVFVIPGLSTSHGNASAFGKFCVSNEDSTWQLKSIEHAYIASDLTIHPYNSILSDCKAKNSKQCLREWGSSPEILARKVEQTYYAMNPNQIKEAKINEMHLITKIGRNEG